MINLSILENFCSWWWFWWLLPFLLGLLLGWAIWAKWKKMVGDLEATIKDLRVKISNLEEQLKKCTSRRSELESDLARLRGQLREAQSERDGLSSQLKLAKNVKVEDNSGQYIAKIDAHASTISNLEAEIRKLKLKNADLDTELLNQRNRNGELVTDMDKLKSDLDSSTKNLDKTTADLAECRKQKASIPVVQPQNLVSETTNIATPTPAPVPAPAPKVDKFAKLKNNNLQIIEGIGPKMESVLHENGVATWSVLASKSGPELKTILDKYGDKYKIIDPSDWSEQAAFARDANWDGLIANQKADGSDSKAEKLMIKLGILKQWSQDDLKAVEGIGPKIEGLLKAGGLNTWRKLANADLSVIKRILEEAGDRYKLADPSTWSKQADMADKGDWDALDEYQDFLNGGKLPG